MVLRDERPRLTMYAANNASFKTTLGGVAAVIDKAWEFVDLKWMFHGASDGSPVIVPPNVLPRGSTDRTGLAGQDPRALIDASHPHDNQTVCVELEPGYHGPRQIVKSLNVALGPMRHTPNETNPKNWTESKPLGCDAALAGAVLWDAAHRLHTINITFCFDFGKFFHQVCMRAGEMCKICALLPERLTAAGATPRLVQLADAVLGMGISCASNIIQELGDELQVELMTQVAIAATPLIDSWRQSNASFDAWCTIREAMPHDQSGSQLRLLMALIFTDDAFWQAVSPEIAALTVSCFHHMIGPAHVTRDEIGVAAEVAALLGARYVAATVPRPAGINLWAAKPYKWGGGISTKWCGAIYSGVFAVVWLPPDKALRTLEGIQLFVQQRMQLLEFRSFHGFLVSVRFALGNDRYLLEGLSVLLKGAGTPDWDGTGIAVCTDRMAKRCAVIADRVSNCSGASMLAAVPWLAPTGQHGVRAQAGWEIGGDAAVSDTPSPTDGLGYCFYGRCVRVPLSWDERLRKWHITVLEALTSGLALVECTPKVPRAKVAFLTSDALATALFLAARAKASALVVVHENILDTPEYRRLVAEGVQLYRRMKWGEVNTLHDAVSRGYTEVVEDICNATKIEVQWLDLSERGAEYLKMALDKLDAAEADACARFGGFDQLPENWEEAMRRARDACGNGSSVSATPAAVQGASVGAYDVRGEVISKMNFSDDEDVVFRSADEYVPSAAAAAWPTDKWPRAPAWRDDWESSVVTYKYVVRALALARCPGNTRAPGLPPLPWL